MDWDRPDTEAGGALLGMACVAARRTLEENAGQYVSGVLWMPHGMRSFQGMRTDAMRPPWGDRTNHGGGWVVGETHREGFILTERPQMARHVRQRKRTDSFQ